MENEKNIIRLPKLSETIQIIDNEYSWNSKKGVVISIDEDKNLIEIKNILGDVEQVDLSKSKDDKIKFSWTKYSEEEFLDQIEKQVSGKEKEYRDIKRWRDIYESRITLLGKLKRFLLSENIYEKNKN